MRGIPAFSTALRGIVGITPVYAGNTSASSLLGALNRDHPRLCGEYIKLFKNGKKLKGSPPSMRGILLADSA